MVKVYRKGKRWQAKIHFMGRAYSRNADTKAEALAVGLALYEELRRDGPRSSQIAPLFFDYCVSDYKPEAKATLAPATYSNRVYQITTLIEHFGDLRLNAITDEHVRQFRAKRRAADILPATVNDEVKVLKAILHDARRRNKFPVSIPSIKPLPEPKRQGHARAWSDVEIRRLFAAVRGNAPDIMPLVIFGLNTGCRKTEIIRLRWDAIHWDTGQISIEPSEEWRPKSNKARLVPLGPAIRPLLERLRDENNAREPAKRSNFVFTGPRGKRPLKFWPQNRFDRARKAAGLVGGPHTMRHTYASHFLANGGTLLDLGKLLGHSDAKVTELYLHMLPGALERAANRVNITPDSSVTTAPPSPASSVDPSPTK